MSPCIAPSPGWRSRSPFGLADTEPPCTSPPGTACPSNSPAPGHLVRRECCGAAPPGFTAETPGRGCWPCPAPSLPPPGMARPGSPSWEEIPCPKLPGRPWRKPWLSTPIPGSGQPPSNSPATRPACHVSHLIQAILDRYLDLRSRSPACGERERGNLVLDRRSS